MPFWEELTRHNSWQHKNLPTIDTRQGMALLIWLLKSDDQAKPIGQLYRESRCSEPTMRECVKAFVAHGLAVIESSNHDDRQRLVRGTPALRDRVQEYRQRLAQLGRDN